MCPSTGSMSSQPSSSMRRVVAVDPGRQKTGIAVVRADGGCDHRQVVPTAEAPVLARRLLAEHEAEAVVVGDRTGSSPMVQELLAEPAVALVLVDEHRSTEEGRRLYLDTVPARGWSRLLPRGLRAPSGPIDDYAAWVLGRRYFDGPGRLPS